LGLSSERKEQEKVTDGFIGFAMLQSKHEGLAQIPNIGVSTSF
jgi:hypothetical protein